MTQDASSDAWDPATYHRFQQERAQPFHDLVALVEPAGVDRMVDLGCGSGELTALAAEQLGATDAVGIDSSAAMLAEAATHARPGLRFEAGDLATWGSNGGPVDLVLANASLQWVPDHADVLARWTSALRPGGQLAVQVPSNADHPAHSVSRALGLEEPFRSAFPGGQPPPDPVLDHVLAPEVYATLLHRLGYAEQQVRLQVYGHLLDGPEDVVRWVQGTSLTRFERTLPADLFAAFVDRYTERLLAELPDERPFFYPFKRILLWARR